VCKRAIDIIQSSKIYYPVISKLNDPFDSALIISNNIPNRRRKKIQLNKFVTFMKTEHNITIDEDFINISDSKFNDLYSEYNKAISSSSEVLLSVSDNFGVISLSGDKNNPLLWSHYANGHKGVAIEFERTDTNLLGKENICFPISYTSYLPEIDNVDIPTTIWKVKFGTKCDIWSYEKEWRILNANGNNEYDLPGNVKGIILGLNITNRNCRKIKKCCEEKGIPVSKCIKVDNEYRLEIVPF